MIQGEDAGLALRLFALASHRYGGLWLRHGGDALVQALSTHLPLRRLPLTIDDDRLLGGIDLADSLAANRPIARTGLLTEAKGEGLLVRGAERLPEALTGRLAQARDGGGPWLVLMDEGRDEERAPPALLDRIAFWIDAEGATAPSFAENPPIGLIDDAALQALAGAAAALGVDSARALIFAAEAARGHAALHGRAEAAEEDVVAAARLILAPRATRIPEEPGQPADQQQAEAPATEATAPADVVVEAIRPHLPAELIAACADRSGSRSAARGQGARTRSPSHGRRVGARAGSPRSGLRLALIDTLRAAAPWQNVRGRGTGPMRLRRDDLRVGRFEDRETMLTVFAVDASGSAAFARLAEAKGAVELMLERAYAKRSEVALVAFRGAGAELLLPPTRSLARARKLLADMAGGGATPLAAGLAAAHEVARLGRSKGRTAQIMVLTDGRGNVAASGEQSRASGATDALAAARRLSADGFPATVLDISARPQPEAAALASAMRARLVHLPRADAAALAAAAA